MNVYADNAATTRMRDAAVAAMLPYLQENYGNASSSHSMGREAGTALREARGVAAACLGCQGGEVIFTSGGSEADNQAILGAALAGAAAGKRHIVSTAFEHHAVLEPLRALRERGFEVELLGVHEYGNVSAREVETALREDTCLVTAMYANNEIGSILPVAEIGRLCRARGVLFHTDAVQAAGHLPIDMAAQNIDMLSLSAHKFGGGKGVGALLVREGLDIAPLIRGGAQQRGRRAGTENIPGVVGMAAALREACGSMAEERARVTRLRDRLIDALLAIPRSVLNGGRENRLPGNVNVSFEGVEGESLLLLLDMKGIRASSGSACASVSGETSHVLRALGRPDALARASLRLTLGERNTPEEADYIAQSVREAVDFLRGAAAS